jgi:hypothetical protein
LNPELEFFPILHEQCVDLERWSVFSLPFNWLPFLPPVWPDLANNFSPIGSLGIFENYLIIPKFFDNIFPRIKVFVNFDKMRFGYILGDFFHKLIWSPCLASTLIN